MPYVLHADAISNEFLYKWLMCIFLHSFYVTIAYTIDKTIFALIQTMMRAKNRTKTSEREGK